MGSYLSSTSQKDTSSANKNTFAIDLDDQPKPVKKQKKKKKKSSNGKTNPDSSQEAKMAEATQQEQQSQNLGSANYTPLVTLTELHSGMPQLVVLSSVPRSQPKTVADNFSLNELDAILERMKAKYRPSPVVLSGKSHGVFEEIEQNLVNCYSKHKEQPLECSKISRDYAAFVHEQRNRILRDATRKDSPIYT